MEDITIRDEGKTQNKISARNLTIEILNDLLQHPRDLENSTLLALSGFDQQTNAEDSEAKGKKVIEILDLTFTNAEEKQQFIVGAVLTDHLRPIFSKSTKKVTASGRPAYFQDPITSKDLSTEDPSWMSPKVHALPTFEWAVREASENTIKEQWPLFMPVLVTLVEAPKTSIRIRGLRALTVFLKKCLSQVLTTTGINAVLEEAIFPSLLSLPTLTPEAESVPLLKAAYESLLQLAEANKDPESAHRRRLLDKMLRDGVFAGVHHASEHVQVVEVLLNVTAEIVEALSIFAAKHLEHILSIISSVLADPFTATHLPLVMAGMRALNTCLHSCWPRFVDMRRAEEVLHMIIRCWLTVHDDSKNINGVQKEMAEVDKALALGVRSVRAICANANLRSTPEMSRILEREPRLATLFDP